VYFGVCSKACCIQPQLRRTCTIAETIGAVSDVFEISAATDASKTCRRFSSGEVTKSTEAPSGKAGNGRTPERQKQRKQTDPKNGSAKAGGLRGAEGRHRGADDEISRLLAQLPATNQDKQARRGGHVNKQTRHQCRPSCKAAGGWRPGMDRMRKVSSTLK